ncbi:DUF4494 domain-containing protein [Alloprevotella tannerae]|uniref:DUF4494 domain-containing protein n=1 Tax=Alloprevotella tannerae TaxID=76122 RepID=A0A929RVS1_9BACT|nr:DUF4494 domain-containing protein [Alloprevotella tannerae]MBF0970160.1 DUF4494 domain-containing protein [Alloprevotella tannerae]
MIMNEWFQCTIKYEKTFENGLVKKVSEPYLVDAISFTEAEKRIIEEIKPFMTGIFEVADIKRAHYAELFESADEIADRFFKAKLQFITLDEKSGKEKKTTQNVLVQAADLRDSIQRLDDGMKTSTIDYTIASVQETAIMDIYHYKEMAPDNFRKVEEA